MHALVATTRYLLLVDLASKQVTPLEGNRPEYYGISWFPGGQELLLSHSGLDNAGLIDIASYAQSEVGWISAGERRSQPFLSAPHQILCASDGRVVCTNTGRNCLSVVDPDNPGHFQEARLGNARWDRLSLEAATGEHLNSLFERDGKLYVLAHRHAQGSWLASFAYPELELCRIEPLGQRSGLHNIWLTGDGLRVSCHSAAGAVVDLVSGKTLWEAGSEVYTRGLAATGEWVLVGASEQSGRELRRSSLSALWIIDRHSWTAQDYLCLGPYGAVNEVRLLDVPDEAHHGRAFTGVERLLGQDMRADLAQRQLSAARAAERGRELWRGFELVFGAPESRPGGERLASSRNLCLMLHSASLANVPLAFDYALDAASMPSHVSAVLGYRGRGNDSEMSALLLQPVGRGAALSLWRHDGQAWTLLPEFGASDLPLAGRLQLARRPAGLCLSIDGCEIVGLPAEIDAADRGPAGIRWIGASVKPCPRPAA